MILKMRKLNLAGLISERGKIFDLLQCTGAVQLKEHPYISVAGRTSAADEEPAEVSGNAEVKRVPEETSALQTTAEATGGDPSRGAEEVTERLEEELAAYERAMELIEGASEQKKGQDMPEITAEEFFSAYKEEETAKALRETAESVRANLATLAAERSKLAKELEESGKYRGLKGKFSDYASTKSVRVRLGTMPAQAYGKFEEQIAGEELCYASATPAGEDCLVLAAAHATAEETLEAALSANGFSPCPYFEDSTGEEVCARISEKLERNQAEEKSERERLSSALGELKKLKIYCEFLAFELEKAKSAALTATTERAFFAEAFVPAEAEERVKEFLDGSALTVWYAFSDPAEGEKVPTLLKNNKVVENFETITNMYSPPDSREFDPNTVMAFFYSLFLGFIMADMGYGLLMAVGGGILYLKTAKKGGMKSLSGVFAVGGIFAVLWGILFNSLFGVAVLPFTAMPIAFDLAGGNFDNYTFMGMEIPAVLVIALFLGIFQLFAGYVCKAVQEWRRGNFFDGLFDGAVWAAFSVGVGIAIAGLIQNFNLPQAFVAAGGGIAGGSLLIAVVTAGRKEKLVGKFTKGFGSVYGIINYASDILSYARLYGLMLSGAVIAQIVSSYSIDFITGGDPVFAVIGVLLMIVGHAFNLAIGLLGAYIHDARLQYVEFYGRFYEGEGELFTPLGSKRRYVALK